MDVRDEIIRSIGIILVNNGIDVSQIESVKNDCTILLGKYEVAHKGTEIALADTVSTNLINIYLGTITTEGKSKKTVTAYNTFLNKFKDEIGKPITQVNAFDIRLWIATKEKTVSLRTCENYRSYLSAFYNWLAAEDMITANPMIKIKPIKYEKVEKKPFSEIEVDSLRSACTTLRQRAELELLLSSGVRVTELCDLNISDVDFINGSISVKCGKGGKARITYMNDVCNFHLKKYVESRTDQSVFLFANKYGERVSKRSVENELHKIGELAHVDNVHPHRCRRTFATNLSKKGMDLSSVKTLMGHSDTNTTMMYVTLNHDRLKNEYARYN